MFNKILIFLVLSISVLSIAADKSFPIRGVLPWHNFLCGPSTWNEADYRAYLDRLQQLDINYIAFHCYTGGQERYSPYVEPMIRIAYRDVLPETGFDTSQSSRWGYRPLPLDQFPFGSSAQLQTTPGANAFGADCAVLSHSNAERYDKAQALMRRVMEMAHERKMQFAMGFEFGIHPPELASIVPPDSRIPGAGLPDPTHPASIEILHTTIDDLLRAYPDIDWIWLWLHEHTMHVPSAQLSGAFHQVYQNEKHLFVQDSNEEAVFSGIWALAYIREAHAYLQQRAPRVQLAISGWGGGDQLMPVLKGLDEALPQEIVFTCLNPNQGWAAQPDFLAEIQKHRRVWAIPWLEGDRDLWHLQPRVTLIRDQVRRAGQQNLDGVLAIHWRTDETRLNLEAFAHYASHPADTMSVESIYTRDAGQQYGEAAAVELAPILAQWDHKPIWPAPYSPEYWPYDPSWGRMPAAVRPKYEEMVVRCERLATAATNAKHKANLLWLADQHRFALLLDEVGRAMQPAYALKQRWYSGVWQNGLNAEEVEKAQKELTGAPVQALITCCGRLVRSRGGMGVLSSVNQRVWLQYEELRDFLEKIVD